MTAFDPASWVRYGRGKELQFFATDEEVFAWLNEFQRKFGSVALVGVRLVRQGTKFVSHYSAESVLKWYNARERSTDFWLELTSCLAKLSLSDKSLDKWCSVNGMVMVQHGDRRKGKRVASRIAIVNRVQHVETGAVHVHDARLEQFKWLKKRIETDLAYSVLQTFPDGHQEESRLQRMTEAAAKLAAQGGMEHLPGTRIQK